MQLAGGKEATTWRFTMNGELGDMKETTKCLDGVYQSSIWVLLRDETRIDECMLYDQVVTRERTANTR